MAMDIANEGCFLKIFFKKINDLEIQRAGAAQRLHPGSRAYS
jgi:hypothetical protein